MSEMQHSNDDGLYRLFAQLPQPATGADFEQQVMQKVRLAALKRRDTKMWEVKSTLAAAAAAAVFAVAAWVAMAALWEQQLFFEAIGQQFMHRCNAGLQRLCNALARKETAYLMVEVMAILIIAYLSGKRELSA